MIDVIAFDADDTLWHTEPHYRETEKKYAAMLAAYGVSAEAALAVLHRIEVENLTYFGYGIRGFTFSLIEAAIEVTGGQVKGTDVQAIVDMGKAMTSHAIELRDGVEETLRQMDGRRLLLITKGDTLDQEGKLRRSGLARYFPAVEIVVDKNAEVYARLLERHAVKPENFLMVGDSLRSDIAPVLAIGGYAVHVPNAVVWAHEARVELPEDRSRFFEIKSLGELPGLIEQIESGGKAVRE